MRIRKAIFPITLVILLLAMILLAVFVRFHNEQKESARVLGTWWWNSNLDAELYLDFAIDNGVNEIYFCDGDLDESTTEFITRANENDIKVFYLTGEKEWVNDYSLAYAEIDRVLNFNNSHPNASFAGVHLDIEPHQFDDFELNRSTLIYNLIDLASNLNERYPELRFDYDIPFWFHDEIEYAGVIKPAYAHMIDIADRVFIMSYRDSAEKMLECASEEIDYATTNGKPLILCVETSQIKNDDGTEEPEITYYEEGKNILNSELEKIRSTLPATFGISIHHIHSWYNLKK